MNHFRLGTLILFSLGTLGIIKGLYSELSFAELVQYDITFNRDLLMMLYHTTIKDHQLPLQYLLIHPIINSGWGGSLIAFRCVSLIFSLGTLFNFYHLTAFFIRKRELRFFALGLLISSSLFMTFSFSARPYAALIFFASGLILSLLKSREEGNKLLWVLYSLLFFSLIAVTHYFGVIYGLCITLGFLCWDKGSLRKIGLTLGVVLVGIVIYWLSSKSIQLRPQRNFPSVSKLIGGLSFFLGGPLSSFLTVIIVANEKLYKKLDFLKCTLIALSPILISLIFSLLFKSVFEYRFFCPSIIFSSLLMVYLIERLDGFSETTILKKRGETAVVLFLIIQALFSVSKMVFSPESKAASSFVKEKLHEEQRVLACGNCPSFYIDRDRMSCMQSWSFRSQSHAKKASLVMVYTLNNKFCLDLVESSFKKIKSFKGIDIYERFSVSK